MKALQELGHCHSVSYPHSVMNSPATPEGRDFPETPILWEFKFLIRSQIQKTRDSL